MANMLKMMKEAASMQKQMKQVQKQLAKEKVTFTNGGITVVARGDLSVDSVLLDETVLSNTDADRLGRQLTLAVNGALSSAKKQAGAQMSKLAAGSGLGGLLGS